jgi:hypothetical protein
MSCNTMITSSYRLRYSSCCQQPPPTMTFASHDSCLVCGADSLFERQHYDNELVVASISCQSMKWT